MWGTLCQSAHTDETSAQDPFQNYRFISLTLAYFISNYIYPRKIILGIKSTTLCIMYFKLTQTKSKQGVLKCGEKWSSTIAFFTIGEVQVAFVLS